MDRTKLVQSIRSWQHRGEASLRKERKKCCWFSLPVSPRLLLVLVQSLKHPLLGQPLRCRAERRSTRGRLGQTGPGLAPGAPPSNTRDYSCSLLGNPSQFGLPDLTWFSFICDSIWGEFPGNAPHHSSLFYSPSLQMRAL